MAVVVSGALRERGEQKSLARGSRRQRRRAPPFQKPPTPPPPAAGPRAPGARALRACPPPSSIRDDRLSPLGGGGGAAGRAAPARAGLGWELVTRAGREFFFFFRSLQIGRPLRARGCQPRRGAPFPTSVKHGVVQCQLWGRRRGRRPGSATERGGRGCMHSPLRPPQKKRGPPRRAHSAPLVTFERKPHQRPPARARVPIPLHTMRGQGDDEAQCGGGRGSQGAGARVAGGGQRAVPSPPARSALDPSL